MNKTIENHDRDMPSHRCALALAAVATAFACGAGQKEAAQPQLQGEERAAGTAEPQSPGPTAPASADDNQTATAAAEPRPPEPRRGGDLVVHEPPQAPTDTIARRLRTHVEGSLSAGQARVWIGVSVPAHVPLTVGTAELTLLDPADGGLLAFYRDPYGASSCTLESKKNCLYVARYYDAEGSERFSIVLTELLSRPEFLEIQDIRYAGGMLYFNEACQSYSKEAGGKCSSLVAVNPTDGKVVWRTPPLISNNVFLVLPEYIVTGYGFTDEPDFISLVSRKDGKVLHRLRLKKAHDSLELVQEEPAVIQARLSDDSRIQIEVAAGKKPVLRFKK